MKYTPETLTQSLRSLLPMLREEFGIEQIALFGSGARGTMDAESDIDIVVLRMERKNGLLLARAKRFLSDKLKLPVDLGFYESMHPFIRKQIEDEMIHV